jgi:hypothetical protein
MTARATPTAHADQLAAATSDARHRLSQVATHYGARLRYDATPAWLVPHKNRLAEAAAARSVRCCPHVGSSPLVVHAAVWNPGRLVCARCIHQLVPDPAEDTTCDRCRRRADPIFPGAIACGPVLLAFGLCHRCLNRTERTSSRKRILP